MASISAPGGSMLQRRQPVATHGVSALRVKPFVGRAPSTVQRQQVRVRAAEEEAAEPVEEAVAAVAEEAEAPPAEDSDFDFSLGDAKKNNDYAASDVEAALRFYFDGGAAPAANEDFISNQLGDEDASFFDDIDNNEAYAESEFMVAGIPEAAPKRKGRGGRNTPGEEEEDDNIAKGKAMDKVKAMEDRMVLEAAMEEEYGSDFGSADAAVLDVAQQGVWDWLTDAEAPVDGAADFSSAKLGSVRRSGATLPSDYEVLSGFSNLKVDELDEQTRDMLDLIIGEEVAEEELRTVDAAVDAEVPDSEGLTDAEATGLDALGNTAVEAVEISGLPAAVPASTDTEFELSKASVDTYVGSLSSAATGASDMTVGQVKELFAADGEAVDVDDEAEPADDAEVAALLAAAEPVVPADENLDLSKVDGLLISAEEEADYEVKDIKADLRSLAVVDDFAEEDMPDEAQLAILEQYLASAEEFLGAEEERRAAATKMVVDGELSADVFAEDLEELPDMESDYAADFADAMAAMEEDSDALAAYDDEEDGETWQERILELNRVTKVTKGGKLMGFRCTAIVGNGKGLVGVGCQAGREVAVAAKRALTDAKRNICKVPLVGKGTIPHKMECKFGAARVVMVPASDGTGVIAGGSIKAVLELAGVQNVLAKRLGCRSVLNNARATVKGLTELQSLNEVSRKRGVPMERLLLPKE